MDAEEQEIIRRVTEDLSVKPTVDDVKLLLNNKMGEFMQQYMGELVTEGLRNGITHSLQSILTEELRRHNLDEICKVHVRTVHDKATVEITFEDDGLRGY